MKSKRYLTSPQQYDKVHAQGSSWSSGPILMRAVPNGLDSSRYGFSVGRRAGNAVKRNRIKRRLREILRKRDLVPGWDMVFVARASAVDSSYASLNTAVAGVLVRARLLAVRSPSSAESANQLDCMGRENY